MTRLLISGVRRVIKSSGVSPFSRVRRPCSARKTAKDLLSIFPGGIDRDQPGDGAVSFGDDHFLSFGYLLKEPGEMSLGLIGADGFDNFIHNIRLVVRLVVSSYFTC